jgi:hypothetical protein
MRLTKLLFCAALIGILTMTAVGQDRGTKESGCPQGNKEIERKDDRFTGEASVTLKPQLIITTGPEQKLKMALEFKIKAKERRRPESFIPEMVNMVFTSESAKSIYGREATLVFLIDGERVRSVPAATHDDYSRLSTEKTLTQTVFTGMTVETLRRINRAKTVEMKLGDTEVKLSAEVLKAMRLFAMCALPSN